MKLTKHVICKYFFQFILLSSLLCIDHAEASSVKVKATPLFENDQEALRYDLLNSLFSHGSVSLKSRSFCEDFGDGKKNTVGSFLALNLRYFVKAQDNYVEANCEKKGNINLCTVNFVADSKGESPWNCGLRFHYLQKTKKIKTATFECIGTC